MASDGPLGLIAGDGELPLAIARAAGATGRDVLVVAFPGITAPLAIDCVKRVVWLNPGQLSAALAFLRESGVRQVAMAGKIPKRKLVAGQLDLDERARGVLAGLTDWNDETLLSALADEIEAEGISLRPQAELVPELLAPEGVLGRVHPTPSQWRDVAQAWPVARAIARLDIGQTVVVHERAVVAVEAIEGTDETIRRAGRLSGPGLCIVKVARPEQDARFDLPAIGIGTLAVVAEAGGGVIAVEAGRSLVIDRERVIENADAAGIALVGVPAAGPPPVDHGEPL